MTYRDKLTEKPKTKHGEGPLCCKGCVLWTQFGKDCFYYWEHKKHCTMWASALEPLAPLPPLTPMAPAQQPQKPAEEKK